MTKFTIRCLIVNLLFLYSFTGFSQDQPVRLGLKIAPIISWMNPNEKDYTANGSALGFSFGFVSEFRLAEHYAISTGFNFSFLSGNLKFPYAQSSDTGTMNRKYNFRYLEIPLMVKMKTKSYGNFDFFGQIGFGTGFMLRTQVNDNFITQTHGTISDKTNLSTSEVSFIREALLVGLGTEYKIDESISLILGLSYSNSLNNVLQGKNNRDPGLSNRSSLNYVELNIGVLF
jgi:opacity protein-like surface antigen